jgi:integrase
MKGTLTHYKDNIWHYVFITDYYLDDKGVKRPHRKKFTLYADKKTGPGGSVDQAEKIWDRYKTGDRFWEADLTLGEYLDRFLEDGQKKNAEGKARWKRQGYIWYERRIRCHIKPKLGNYQISEITTRIVADFLIDVSKAGRYLPAHCYSILRACWQQMIFDGDVGVRDNLIKRVRPPETPTAENPIWNVDQAKTFLEAVAPYRYHLVYFVAFTTGMRINEVLGLRWRDVDLEKGIISVRNKLEKSGMAPEMGTPKTKRSVRPIKAIPALIKELNRHKKTQAIEKMAARAAKVHRDYGEEFGDLVFCKMDGGPVDHDYLRKKEFNPAIKKIQIEDKTFPRIAIRDLRHSAANYLIDLGTDIRIVAEILGHSTSKITESFYLKDNVKRQEKAFEKMQKDFG